MGKCRHLKHCLKDEKVDFNLEEFRQNELERLTESCIETFNFIRKYASESYLALVPLATKENFRKVERIMMNHKETKEEHFYLCNKYYAEIYRHLIEKSRKEGY